MYCTTIAKVISHGKGGRVYDADGREYIDYVMGGGPMMLGHAHPAVTDAVAGRMPSGTSFFGLTESIIEHAGEICRHTPCAEQVSMRAAAATTAVVPNSIRQPRVAY